MDEVKAMSRAGETVGKAVGTGLRTARRSAIRAGRKGAEASSRAACKAERQLAKHGMSAQQIQEIVAGSTEAARAELGRTREELGKRGRKARKELAKSTKATRKELAKNTRRARKALAAKIEPGERRRHRRWPWLLGLAGIAAICVYVVSRRPQEVFTEDDGTTAAEPGPTVAEPNNGQLSTQG